ncbi:MAG: DUF1566 domain-containing protein [Chitinophagia bacterium]|nr:DUF1566 domain-containing protein [Chitinophagia bacterium]
MNKTNKILLSFFLILISGFGFSQSVPSYVPTNGLVGWWPLDINPNNSFGNGLNGSFNGSFVSSGRNCAQFNNSLLVIPGEPVFNISNFTTSYWIKINSHTIHTGIQFGIPNGPLRWAIGWYPSAFLFAQMTCAGGWGQGNYFDNNVNFNTGTWYHLTIVHIGITTKLYINSNLIGTLSTAAPLNCWNSSMNLYIGGDIGGGAIEYFDGYIDDFGFWNRALTQQEITNLYNSQVPQPCTTSVTTSLNINGCGFAVLSNGDTVTQTGNYLDTLSTLGGCDSIINQSVTIQPSSNCNPIPSYVPTNGLVGWWGFNGNAQDGSGNGNHGTVNGATLTTDRFGNQNGAYEFSNTFGRIQSVQLNLSNAFTFQISIKLNNYNQIGTPFEINEGFSCNLNPQIWPNNGNLYLARCGNGMLNPLLIGDINSLIGVWTHLVVVHERSTTRLYKNGTLISVINHQWPQTSLVNLTLANDGNTPFNYQSKCTFDDLGIWNRALTQQEITNLYNSQLPTQTSLCLPTITTTSPSSVGVDTVVIGGDISNDGGSSIVLRGVCYSTSPNPNMGNSRTEDGSGIGSFNTVLRGLNPSTTYYARSYAKNSNGVVVYGNEVSFSTAPIIGSNYAGGIVFYLDGTGQHGLVCAPSDQGNFQWGCYGTNIEGTSSAYGTGQANTTAIVNGCSDRPIAASACDDLVLNGYSDWYLPSIDELQLMYSNLHVQGFGGYSNAWYWSSSQYNHYFASYMDFANGNVAPTTPFKNFNLRVRAVRAF